MVNYRTQAQTEELCIKVGFSKADAHIAAAISMVEGQPNPPKPGYNDFDLIGDQALATDYWGPSYGAFQVRSIKDQSGTGGHRDATRLNDPEFNCASALEVYQNQGWNAWTVYREGKHKAYLQDLYPPKPGTIVVMGGDTLSKIASRISKGAWTWQDMARVNGLHSPYRLSVGQTLTLPGAATTPAPKPERSHIVKAGDYLGRIASTYGVTVASIVALNGITDPDHIRVGTVLRIPAA